jgi:hypothetical protein
MLRWRLIGVRSVHFLFQIISSGKLPLSYPLLALSPETPSSRLPSPLLRAIRVTALYKYLMTSASEPSIRHHYVEMVEAVRSRGGEALIFSSMHESGQQLDQISGIAAILTYPLDVEIVEMEEREEKERVEREKRESGGEE